SATVGLQFGTGERFAQVACNVAALTNGERIDFIPGPCGPSPTPTNTFTVTNTATPSASATPIATCGPGSDYVILPSTGASIVAGTTDIGNHTDDGVTTISLPFTYNLYAQPFTSAGVSSNGTLQFGGTITTYINTCL